MTSNNISTVTQECVDRTPIVSFLRKRVTFEQLEGWESLWRGFVNREGYARPLPKGLKVFFELASAWAHEISNSQQFDGAVAFGGLNKYETCIVSGIRALQEEHGMRPNFNHVKFKSIRKTYHDFS